MNSKAQASLEYLMTYGWALILITTIVSVLILVMAPPSSMLVFSSSDPTKILVKGASAIGDEVEIKLQNITGGKIEVTKITVSVPFSGGTANGQDIVSGDDIEPPIVLLSGGTLHIENMSYGGGTAGGRISIEYTDYAGLGREVSITGGPTGGEAGEPPGAVCGNGQLESGEVCDGALFSGSNMANCTAGCDGAEIIGCTPISVPGSYSINGSLSASGFGDCITITSSDVALQCFDQMAPSYLGFDGTGATGDAFVLTNVSNVSIQDCTVEDFPGLVVRVTGGTGNSLVNIWAWDNGSGISVSNSTSLLVEDVYLEENGDFGLLLANSPSFIVRSSTINTHGWSSEATVRDNVRVISSDNGTIESTAMNYAGGTGLYVEGSNNFDIIGGTIDWSSGHGLHLKDTTGSITIDDPNIYGSWAYGSCGTCPAEGYGIVFENAGGNVTLINTRVCDSYYSEDIICIPGDVTTSYNNIIGTTDQYISCGITSAPCPFG